MIYCPNCKAKIAIDEHTIFSIDCDCGYEILKKDAEKQLGKKLELKVKEELAKKYCSKCGRPLIDQHCPVHIMDMEPVTQKDTIMITIEELNNLYKNKEKLDRLEESLEIRKKQLMYQHYKEDTDIEGIDLSYKLHSGHHMRDICTVLAVLQNNKQANLLLANMPQRKTK